jgi:hypothetical protein
MHFYVRVEISTEMVTKVTSLYFGRQVNAVSEEPDTSDRMMKAASHSETLLPLYQITRGQSLIFTLQLVQYFFSNFFLYLSYFLWENWFVVWKT